MIKKLIVGIVAFVVFYARADYQTVDGIEWEYDAWSYEARVKGISSHHYNPIEVTIPAVLGGVPVTRIDSGAFQNCDFLLSVVIPGTVEEIGSDAFEDCERLISVTIPSSVRYIHGGFRNCTMLQSVTIPKDTVFYSGSGTFEGCRSLTSVTIPSPPNGIMNNMFEDCTSLTSVKILGDCYGISSEAFSGCSSLSSITIPNKVRYLWSHAFKDCISLTSITIPDSVTSIESRAFEGCNGLTSVKIGTGVTSIGLGAFEKCTSLESFQVAAGNTCFSARNGMLCDKSGTMLISATCGSGDVRVPDGIVEIGASAFKGHDSLYNIAIPDSVRSIGDSAFYECRNLTDVAIPNSVTNIGKWAFRDCNSLTEVFIPESVTSIGDGAFSYCDNLRTVYVPEDCAGSVPYEVRYKSVLVKFDCNGMALDGVDPMDAKTKFKIGELPSPKSERMVFRGWWTEKDGGQQVTEDTIVLSDMVLYAHWEAVPNPVITSSKGTLFASESSVVSISCSMPEAKIYYSDTGKTPKESDLYLYTEGFEITGSATIKAVAVFDGARSEYVTLNINQKEITFEEAIEQDGLEVKLGGDAEWNARFVDSAPVGGHCARSGEIGDDSESWMEINVSGAGALSFWSKTSCEHDADNTFTWDRFMVYTNGVEIAEWRMDGESEWTKRMLVFTGGENTVRWCYYKDESVSDGMDCAYVDAITWVPSTSTEALPELDKSASDEEVASALACSADVKLVANITDVANYAAYREWALGVKAADGSAVAGPEAVKNAPNAWLSYALDTEKLIATAPVDGDVTIDTFENAATDGAFKFTVNVKDVSVGDGALEENIRKIFDVEGVEDLATRTFAADAVEVNAAAAEGGKVKFTVTPKGEDGAIGSSQPTKFFFKVRLK